MRKPSSRERTMLRTEGPLVTECLTHFPGHRAGSWSIHGGARVAGEGWSQAPWLRARFSLYFVWLFSIRKQPRIALRRTGKDGEGRRQAKTPRNADGERG